MAADAPHRNRCAGARPGSRPDLRVVLKYDPPGGKLGAWLAWLFGEAPGQQIEADLRRFKQQMEAGAPAYR